MPLFARHLPASSRHAMARHLRRMLMLLSIFRAQDFWKIDDSTCENGLAHARRAARTQARVFGLWSPLIIFLLLSSMPISFCQHITLLTVSPSRDYRLPLVHRFMAAYHDLYTSCYFRRTADQILYVITCQRMDRYDQAIPVISPLAERDEAPHSIYGIPRMMSYAPTKRAAAMMGKRRAPCRRRSPHKMPLKCRRCREARDDLRFPRQPATALQAACCRHYRREMITTPPNAEY